MCGIGRTVRINCHIRITMVSNYQSIISLTAGCLNNFSDTFVDCLYCFHYCLINTCMPYHITVCKIQADKIILLCFDSLYYCILYLVCTHLRLEIVGRDFWRGYQCPVFIVKHLFPTSREKECNMCIFFSLGNSQLIFPCKSKYFTYCIINVFLGIDNMKAFKCCIIRCHCAIMQWYCFHSLVREIFLGKGNSELPCPVITKVNKDNHISFLDCSYRITIIINHDDRFHKLISNTCIIRLLHGTEYVGCRCSFAVDNKVVSLLNSFPSFIPVHCIISSYKRSYLTVRFAQVVEQVLHISLSASRIGITSVTKAMYKNLL